MNRILSFLWMEPVAPYRGQGASSSFNHIAVVAYVAISFLVAEMTKHRAPLAALGIQGFAIFISLAWLSNRCFPTNPGERNIRFDFPRDESFRSDYSYPPRVETERTSRGEGVTRTNYSIAGHHDPNLHQRMVSPPVNRGPQHQQMVSPPVNRDSQYQRMVSPPVNRDPQHQGIVSAPVNRDPPQTKVTSHHESLPRPSAPSASVDHVPIFRAAVTRR